MVRGAEGEARWKESSGGCAGGTSLPPLPAPAEARPRGDARSISGRDCDESSN